MDRAGYLIPLFTVLAEEIETDSTSNKAKNAIVAGIVWMKSIPNRLGKLSIRGGTILCWYH